MKNFRAAKVSNQIIQLFGRINRGRNDYGAFVINGKTLSNWLGTNSKARTITRAIEEANSLGSFSS